MTTPKTVTLKVNLGEVELLTWALYVLNRGNLSNEQLIDLDKLESRLAKAEDKLF